MTPKTSEVKFDQVVKYDHELMLQAFMIWSGTFLEGTLRFDLETGEK